MDLYTAVTTAYAKGENTFTGKIKKVTINVKSDAAKKETGGTSRIPE